MSSSRVILCHLDRMGKLEKLLDTNISLIKASPSTALDEKAVVSDDNLTSDESKHERKKGGYITDRLYLNNILLLLKVKQFLLL